MGKVSYSDVENIEESKGNSEDVENKGDDTTADSTSDKSTEAKANPLEEKVDKLSQQYEAIANSLQAINSVVQQNNKPKEDNLKGQESAVKAKQAIQSRKQQLLNSGVKAEEMKALMEMMEVEFAEKYGIDLDSFVQSTNQTSKNVENVYGLASNLAYREAVQELAQDIDLNDNEDLLIGFKDWKKSDWDKRKFTDGDLKVILSDPVNVLRTEYEKYHTKLLTKPELKAERKKLMEEKKVQDARRKKGAGFTEGQSSGLSRTLTEDDVKPKKRTVNEAVISEIMSNFDFLNPPAFTGEDKD